MNLQRQTSIFFILLGMSIVILALFPPILPGADSAFGHIQVGLLLAGLGFVMFGFDFDHQPDDRRMDLRHFIQYQAGVFVPWVAGGILYALVTIISPRFSFILENSEVLSGCAFLLFMTGILRRLWLALAPTHLMDFFRSMLNRASNFHWGIVLLFLSLSVGFYSEIVRGGLLVFGVFFLIGIGPALFLFSPNRRSDYAIAFAPVIGFALMTVIGSWLVILDLPVQKWAWGATVGLFAVSGLLILLWRKYFPAEWQAANHWRLLNEFGLACGVVLLIMAPVAIGGLKFSVLRGNQGDARNYMSMAAFLTSLPYSQRGNLQMLFNNNPAVFWAASLLHTRWATSMLMAYATEISQIPLYRFDFAFTALPFALVFAPVRAYLKSTPLRSINIFLVALSISAGYYAQVVLDSRAVSFATALPILVSFVLLIARILDDNNFYQWNWPVYSGELLSLMLLTTALFLLYIEIFAFLLPGMFLSFVYYILRQILSIKKFLAILASSIAGLLLVAITLPAYIKFFIRQITVSQQLFVSWHLVFFPWIYEDAPAGVWGLNPYQLTPVLSIIMRDLGWMLALFLFLGLVPLILPERKTNHIYQLSAFLTLGGLIIFAYTYFREQLWQAGKFFTYSYPFLILYMAELPLTLKELRLPKLLTRIPLIIQVGISIWLVSQISLSGYRFFVTGKGYEYPFHVQSAGHTYETYSTKYAWNVAPFLEQIQKVATPVVWVSTNSIFADNFWALIFDQKAGVLAVHPMMGQIDATKWLLNSNLLDPPDFIIVNNLVWNFNNWNNTVWKAPPILYQDEQYSMIQMGHRLPEHVLLIGMRSNPYSLMIQPNLSFIVSEGASLVFFSSTTCRVYISADISMSAQETNAVTIQIAPHAAEGQDRVVEVQNNGQNIQELIDLEKGYNLVPIKVTFLKSVDPETLVISLTDLRFTEINCSTN